MKTIEKIEVNKEIIQVKLSNVEKNPIIVSEIFEDLHVNIDMISSVVLEDEMRIDFTVDLENQKELIESMNSIQSKHPRIEVYSRRDVAKVSISGEMEEEAGVAAKVFEVFAKTQVPFMQISTSKSSIDVVVEKKYIDQVVNKLEEMI